MFLSLNFSIPLLLFLTSGRGRFPPHTRHPIPPFPALPFLRPFTAPTDPIPRPMRPKHPPTLQALPRLASWVVHYTVRQLAPLRVLALSATRPLPVQILQPAIRPIPVPVHDPRTRRRLRPTEGLHHQPPSIPARALASTSSWPRSESGRQRSVPRHPSPPSRSGPTGPSPHPAGTGHCHWPAVGVAGLCRIGR